MRNKSSEILLVADFIIYKRFVFFYLLEYTGYRNIGNKRQFVNGLDFLFDPLFQYNMDPDGSAIRIQIYIIAYRDGESRIRHLSK